MEKKVYFHSKSCNFSVNFSFDKQLDLNEYRNRNIFHQPAKAHVPNGMFNIYSNWIIWLPHLIHSILFKHWIHLIRIYGPLNEITPNCCLDIVKMVMFTYCFVFTAFISLFFFSLLSWMHSLQGLAQAVDESFAMQSLAKKVPTIF